MNRILAYLHKFTYLHGAPLAPFFFFNSILKSQLNLKFQLLFSSFTEAVSCLKKMKREYFVMVYKFKSLSCYWELFWHLGNEDSYGF